MRNESLRQKYLSYQKAALKQGQQYFNYENIPIPIDNKHLENYQICSKIGRGKYSDVYKCVRLSNNQSAVLKILKPGTHYSFRQSKICREIKILNQLSHPNIVNLEAVMQDPISKCYCLAFQFVQTTAKQQSFTAQTICIYMRQILQALDYAHSKGIMHRDIKPQNILIDQTKKIAKIADWGLADFYLPKMQFNVRVASRYYKGPELLLNNKYYDYSLDIWSLGLMFAGMIFQRSAIFKGDDNPDQLRKLMKVFGSKQIKNYILKYNLKPDQKTTDYINQNNYPKVNWTSFINSQNKSTATKKAIDLLQKMLVIDHEERISAIQALEDPYFKYDMH